MTATKSLRIIKGNFFLKQCKRGEVWLSLNVSSNFFFFFLDVLGLHCCVWASSSCSEQGLLFVAVRGLLIVVASLVAEHGL